MKNIAILTFHFCENFGAVMQCYALKRTVESLGALNVTIINYCPWEDKNTYRDLYVKNSFDKKTADFSLFREEYLNIHSTKLRELSAENSSDCDIYIVGSDQVWNPLYGKYNKAYFLSFVPGPAKKISYAASLGLDLEHPLIVPQIYKENLAGFDAISVREDIYKDFLEHILERKVYTTLDPALLLNVADYDLLADQADCGQSTPFILLYTFELVPAMIEYANVFARYNNWDIIHFYGDMPEDFFTGKSKTFAFDGPKEILWYFQNAQMVLTSTYHGIVFAVLFDKNFYAWVDNTNKIRLKDLLHKLGLEDRIITGFLDIERTKAIDFSRVKQKLQIVRETSLDYLCMSLGL
jgi:hypothetical protein